MKNYLGFSAMAVLVLCFSVAMNMGPQMMASEVSFVKRFFGMYDDLKIEQTGTIDYRIPVSERRVAMDPRDSVVRYR